MFDLETMRRESGLAPDDLARLEAQGREEFEGDEMMFELHLLRIVKAIKGGWVTLEEALTETVEL